MRWIDLEVFVAGEPDPYPARVPAVRRRLRAVPLDPSPLRTWLLPSPGGIRAWHRVHDARRQAVVGHAWVRRSTLRRRRLAWVCWVAGLLATVGVTLASARPGRPDPAPLFGLALLVLILLALLLVATRVRAVIDPEDGRVGVRG